MALVYWNFLCSLLIAIQIYCRNTFRLANSYTFVLECLNEFHTLAVNKTCFRRYKSSRTFILNSCP